MMTREQKDARNLKCRIKHNAKRAEWLAANPGYKKKNGRYPKPDSKQKRAESSRRRVRERAGIVGATGETRFGTCPICEEDKDLVCDHDHETGTVRGWLCSRCNLGIGRLGDRLENLRRLVSYVETEI